LTLTAHAAGDSAFWHQQAQRFVALRQQVLQQSGKLLDASYHPEGWGLESVRAFRGRCSGCWLLGNGLMTAVDEFKSIAAVCAVALGSPNTDLAWVEWLDCSRRDSSDFKAGELTVDSRLVQRRPEPDFEVFANGLLYPPVEVRPDPEPQVISTELWEIDDVCTVSERLCRRLADEVLKVELTTRDTPALEHGAHRAGPIPSVPNEIANPNASRALTLKEAAKLIHASEDTLHRMRDRGEIAMFKAGAAGHTGSSSLKRIVSVRVEYPRFGIVSAPTNSEIALGGTAIGAATISHRPLVTASTVPSSDQRISNRYC